MKDTIILVAVLAGIGVGGYFIYKQIKNAQPANNSDVPTQVGQWTGALGGLGGLFGSIFGSGNSVDNNDSSGLTQDEWDFIGGGN